MLTGDQRATRARMLRGAAADERTSMRMSRKQFASAVRLASLPLAHQLVKLVKSIEDPVEAAEEALRTFKLAARVQARVRSRNSYVKPKHFRSDDGLPLCGARTDGSHVTRRKRSVQCLRCIKGLGLWGSGLSNYYNTPRFG